MPLPTNFSHWHLQDGCDPNGPTLVHCIELPIKWAVGFFFFFPFLFNTVALKMLKKATFNVEIDLRRGPVRQRYTCHPSRSFAAYVTVLLSRCFNKILKFFLTGSRTGPEPLQQFKLSEKMRRDWVKLHLPLALPKVQIRLVVCT